MNTKTLLVLVAASGLLGWLFYKSPSQTKAKLDSKIVASVGDTEVRAEDLASFLRTLSLKDKAILSRNPSALDQVVRTRLAQKLVLKEALEKKWDKDASVVDQLEILKQNLIVESYLRSISTPPDSYPSSSELKSAYDANREDLRMPRQYRMAQIFMTSPTGASHEASDAIRKKLEDIQKHPDTFSEFAKANSQDALSASHGGEIGWVVETQMQPEVRPVVLSLEKGMVSAPFQLKDGWHLVRLLDMKESYIPTLDEVKPLLVQQLRIQKTRANSQEYLVNLMKNNPVKINEVTLAQELGNLTRN